MPTPEGLDARPGAEGASAGSAASRPRVITDVAISPRRGPPAMLPALRADLAPLAPVVGRTVAVLATVALADWALRAGTRALWREGLQGLAGRALGAPSGAPAAVRVHEQETVIVERITLHRRSS